MFVSGMVDEERNVTSKKKIHVEFKYKKDIMDYVLSKDWQPYAKLDYLDRFYNKDEVSLVYDIYIPKSDCWEMMKELGLAGWYENKTMRIY